MISSTTQVTGLLGHPVAHSKSPQMHNSAFQHLGLDFVYLAFDVLPQLLGEAVQGIRALGMRGVNVTIPHKVEVIRYLDEISEDAQLIGAVNTIVQEEGRLIGYNTDGSGYVRSLREEVTLDLSQSTVMILGAGGAARAIAVQMALFPVQRLFIANRTIEMAEELAKRVQHLTEAIPLSLGDAPRYMHRVDVLINTTSLGMYPHIEETPLAAEYLHEGMVVSDLIYNPRETRLLREAKARGALTHSGLSMFIYQGAEAFALWTGKEAPVAVMRHAVESALQP